MTTRALLEAADGAAQIAVTTLGAPLLRRRYNTWGATLGETRGGMPGDDLLPEPRIAYTRALTVDVPPERLWPWLAQIGHGRGGLYSYDVLENLAGCDLHSADALLPECPPLVVGDLVHLGPEGYPAFRVARLEGPNLLVLVSVDPRTGEAPALPVTADGGGGSVWQWQLRPWDHGSRTRLVVRQRITYPTVQSPLWHVIEPVNFVMERKMMLGLKRRAEAAMPPDLRLARARA